MKMALALVLWVLATDSVGQDTADPPAPPIDMEIRSKTPGSVVLHGVPVPRLFAPRIDEWHLLNWRHVVVYVAKSGPYLIVLREDLHRLGRTSTIGYKYRGTTIDARFDNLIVNGYPYGIERIEKLEPEVALRLRGIDPGEHELASGAQAH